MEKPGLGGQAGDRGFGEALEALWARYRSDAFENLNLIEDAAAALAAGTLDAGQREQARAAAHKLRGSAGTFGRHRASEIAGELEDVLATDGEIPANRVPEVASLVLSLRSELEADPQETGRGPEPGGDEAPFVLLVCESDQLCGRISAAASDRSLRLEVCRFSDAPEQLRKLTPVLVLLDLAVEGSTAAGLGLLDELVRDSAVPAMALAGSDALRDRVEAARLGAVAFLDRELDPQSVLDAVEKYTESLRDEPVTVLAVDDDASVLAALRALLGSKGFTVETVEDPESFWERLEAVVPDVAIVDLDMPQVNGIDLCRTIRADPRWAGLPLLILTAYRDPELVRRAYAAGADDFLSKPIIEEELVRRVNNRLERVRAYREASRRDELTGVAGRRAVAAEIDRLVEIAAAAGEPAAVALLDVDGLRAINSKSGNAAGDAFLRRIGELLEREFRHDAVGRWDGDEFVIAMSGMPGTAAAERVQALLAELNGDGTSPASVSAGVAGAAGAASGASLIDAASGALEEAKRAGGARLAVAGDRSKSENQVEVVIVEDDASVVDVLKLAVETLHLSYRTFNDGAAAAAELAGDPPALTASVVLLDWDLPGLDGLSVLRQLADAGVLARTRVLMLTARASEDETVKALELGASDHVAKPFSVPVLVERLRKYLAPAEAGAR